MILSLFIHFGHTNARNAPLGKFNRLHRATTRGESPDMLTSGLEPQPTVVPTLLLQYHFDTGTGFRPYVGAGVNYTIAYFENADRSLEAVPGPTSVRADDSVGWAVQAGVDYHINERWFINLDVKYIDIGLDVELNSRGVVRNLEVDINPVVVGIRFGYRF